MQKQTTSTKSNRTAGLKPSAIPSLPDSDLAEEKPFAKQVKANSQAKQAETGKPPDRLAVIERQEKESRGTIKTRKVREV